MKRDQEEESVENVSITVFWKEKKRRGIAIRAKEVSQSGGEGRTGEAEFCGEGRGYRLSLMRDEQIYLKRDVDLRQTNEYLEKFSFDELNI